MRLTNAFVRTHLRGAVSPLKKFFGNSHSTTRKSKSPLSGASIRFFSQYTCLYRFYLTNMRSPLSLLSSLYFKGFTQRLRDSFLTPRDKKEIGTFSSKTVFISRNRILTIPSRQPPGMHQPSFDQRLESKCNRYQRMGSRGLRHGRH